ncbi:MAG: cupredoxin family copper-binding protein [Pseudomonadota bacterium]
MFTKRLFLAAIAAAFIAPSTAAFADGHAHTVTISGFAFEPASLTVNAGDTITFVNEDGAPHTATAAGVFDTGRLGNGASAAITVSDAGTYDYICSFHPNMRGSIIVE